MAVMRAVELVRTAGPEEWEPCLFDDVERVAVLEGKFVRVSVKACGLSCNDTEVLAELHRSKSRLPVGQEISGVVTEVGPDVTLFSVGYEVVGLLPLDSPISGCAEECIVPEHCLVSKPASVSYVDAAGCVGGGLSAYTALHYLAHVCSGEAVLVCNGTSPTGIIAIQLAQQWNARVMATASTHEESLFLESHRPPLTQVIEIGKYRRPLLEVCLEETGGLGVDCIIDLGSTSSSPGKEGDSQSNDSLSRANSPGWQSPEPQLRSRPQASKHELISCLAVGGRLVTSNRLLQLDPPHSDILFMKGASVCFLNEHTWLLSRSQQGRYLHVLNDLMRKVEENKISPTIHHTVVLADACQALQQLSQFVVGKVVMRAD